MSGTEAVADRECGVALAREFADVRAEMGAGRVAHPREGLSSSLSCAVENAVSNKSPSSTGSTFLLDGQIATGSKFAYRSHFERLLDVCPGRSVDDDRLSSTARRPISATASNLEAWPAR